MSKATWAKLAGWGQVALTAIGEAIQANGVPKDAKAWLHILIAAAVGLAVHHAAGTDGSK